MSEDWINVTVVGSSYEEHLDMRSDRRRHRLLSAPAVRGQGFMALAHREGRQTEWIPGPAPKGQS